VRLTSLLLAGASLLAPLAVRAQADNMILLGQLDPQPGGSYSDVWAFVGSDGREYALLASWLDGGLNVIDVTGTVPVLEEHVPMNGDGSDIEAYGNYAYITSNFSPTLIVDLSNPTNPAPVRTFGGDFHTLSIADGYLYGNGSGGVMIYSLANPTNPVFVGDYDPYYVHDILVRGNTMYTAGIYGDGIDIVDISNKANPVLIERFNYPGSGAHNICSDPSGSYLYVGDEIGSGNWTRIFDVRDPHNVEQVGEIIVDPNSVVHNCHTKDNLLYLAHYDRGVWVFDISDPVNPVQVGFYETGVSSSGIWTVNPHLPSGKILASDMSNGLLVLRLDLPQGVTAGIEPVGSTTIPPGGGSFQFAVTLTNTTGQSQTVQAWTSVEGPVDRDLVLGPRTVTLPGGATVTQTLTQVVPGNAPPGTYSYAFNVGTFPGPIVSSDAITVVKEGDPGARAAGDGTGWDVSGWTEAAPEAALAGSAAAGVDAYPNPFATATTIRFVLEAPSAVRLAVYDVLGREVARLVDGQVDAGRHEATLAASSLPSGTYLVRLEAGGEVQTRRITLVR
jgi:choice-of-anchor B domain-containing protein